ncbi:unnamed protein product, partial [Arabidopsis halleri]
LNSVLYTRGRFFWPQMQPDPHSLFSDEKLALAEKLNDTNLGLEKVEDAVLGVDDEKQWHILSVFPHAADNNTKEVLIHVVPEEAWSFASFECCGYEFKDDESHPCFMGFSHGPACFKPKMFTLAIRSNLPVIGGEPQCNLDPDGYSCKREICSVVYYYTV